ncbi:MAG: NAD(P)-dependent alcohol dehydrogenase [Pseudomonadota bacterium]
MAPLESNEIRVRVRSAAVNPLDWHYMRGSPYLMRLGSGLGRPEDPKAGVDFAGEVEAVGDAVTRFAPGDRVFGGASGAFAEVLTINEDRAVAKIPDGISYEQMASFPIAAITALQALRDHANLQAGQRVLINGASGGVGTFAVQIAKAMGAEVTGVCSDRNVAMVKSLGADHVIDYKTTNFTEGQERYDAVIDMVGNHSMGRVLDVVEPTGKVVLVGGAKGDWIAPLVGPLSALLRGPFVDQELSVVLAQMNAADLEALAEMAQAGQVRAVVDRTYPLSQVAEAVAYSETGRARGKILLDPSAG